MLSAIKKTFATPPLNLKFAKNADGGLKSGGKVESKAFHYLINFWSLIMFLTTAAAE